MATQSQVFYTVAAKSQDIGFRIILLMVTKAIL